MAKVLLAFGSNLGERLLNLRRAFHCISAQVRVIRLSSVYQTPPWGYTEQPPFLNLVLQGTTSLSPQALLEFLKSCERALGRQPTFRYGPRQIDLDILAYDRLILETPELTLPHPHLHERAFVLLPLCEIAPRWRHPRLGKTATRLLAECDAHGIQKLLSPAQFLEVMMSEIKPLNWQPIPGIGYSVSRRSDGGMNIVFTHLDDATIEHWKNFALEHLLGADRRTRNLYDLRAVQDVPEKAIRTAIEVNNDPAARNIRLAVVVANEKVANAIREIAALAFPAAGAAVKLFTDINEAEAWLSRPLDQIP